MTEAAIKFAQGRGLSLATLFVIAAAVLGLIWEGGKMASTLEDTVAKTARNNDDIISLKSDLSSIKAGQDAISKNVDRVLNKLDTIAPAK